MKTPWRWWREYQAKKVSAKMRNGFDRTTESFHCLADAMKEAAKEYKSLNLNTTMGNLLSCDGRRFRCKIDGTLATGIIRVVDKCVYLCQNEKNGFHSIDKKGYKYAWCVYSGTEADFANPSIRVTDFRLIPITAAGIEVYKDWQEGDKLTCDCNDYEIIFRSGEAVILKDDDGRAAGPFTCDELYEDGFRLFVDPAPEEEIVEVTMDEIAGKMGVPVERLRVKKEK